MSQLRKPPKPKSLEEAHQLIDELWHVVEDLRQQVEELSSRLAKSSRNSSKPPSSDSQSQREKRRGRRKKSSRGRGAQPGHKRNERPLDPESSADAVERYFPDSHCGCGGTIAIDEQPRCRHQVFDIPVVRHTMVEHQIFGGLCLGCGKQKMASLPNSVPSGQMGPGLIAEIAHMAGKYRMTIRQIQDYLREHFQLTFCTGAISAAQAKANTIYGEPYRQIGEHVRAQAVAHADETRHFRGTECRWLWALVSTQAVFLMVHFSRGKQAASDLLGRFGGFLVTDDYVAYDRVSEARRQLCWAHLTRHFVAMSERRGNAGKVGARLLLIAHALFRTRHRRDSGGLDETRYHRRAERLRQSFQKTLERGARLRVDSRTQRQCKRLLGREAMCWTFLKDPRIPLTNNVGEQALRGYVIWRKISFASQSYQGDQFRPLILTVVGTAEKLGISSYHCVAP